MRITRLCRSLLRAASPTTPRTERLRKAPDNLDRALQGALEWDTRHRARRKRLGIE